MIRISIPPTLRRFCDGEEAIHVPAEKVADVFERLDERFHGVRQRLVDPAGRIRGSVIITVNDQDVRFLRDRNTELKPGDEVGIIPAYAGG